MASEHTQNYNLSRWTLADEVRMEDFNSDNEKIDAALAELEQSKGNCTLTPGTYIGTGKGGGSSSTKTSLELGFTPKLLLIQGMNTYHLGIFVGGAYLNTCLGSNDVSMLYTTWTDTGLSWYTGTNQSSKASYQFDQKDETYLYLAFR